MDRGALSPVFGFAVVARQEWSTLGGGEGSSGNVEMDETKGEMQIFQLYFKRIEVLNNELKD